MADITKIQPMGDSTQYELGARYLTTSRTIWGQSFNGTANVSGNLKDVGDIYGLSNKTTLSFLTSSNEALYGKFGAVGISGNYGDTDLSTYGFDIYNKCARFRTENAALGIDSNYKIGTARKTIHIQCGNSSGTGLNDGYASGITFGDGSAYAGIYYLSSGSYGSRLILGTTNSYANGTYGRVIITHDGKVGVGTMTPSYKLSVSGDISATNFRGALIGNVTGNVSGSSGSCTGNAASATKLQTARTIWGLSFNGTANITGLMTNVGPNMYLPSGQSAFSFLTSAGGAGNGKFGRLLLSDNYSTGDLNGYRLDVYGGSARIYNGYLYITANGNTVTIGSLNSGWCHFTNSANISFYFNKSVHVDGDIYRYNTNTYIGSYGFYTKTGGMRLLYNGSWWNTIHNHENANVTLDACGGGLWCGYTQTNVVYLLNGKGTVNGNGVYGAVWNDYAEFREVPEALINYTKDTNAKNINKKELLMAGRCVCEVGDDTMIITTKRLLKGCKIISDTYGFCIGETETQKTPIAVSGRALVYIYEGREEARKHIGDCVCSGPNGTVSIMTEEEEMRYPGRIVGTISAVPDYEVWGENNISINDRIWIYVR